MFYNALFFYFYFFQNLVYSYFLDFLIMCLMVEIYTLVLLLLLILSIVIIDILILKGQVCSRFVSLSAFSSTPASRLPEKDWERKTSEMLQPSVCGVQVTETSLLLWLETSRDLCSSGFLTQTRNQDGTARTNAYRAEAEVML